MSATQYTHTSCKVVLQYSKVGLTKFYGDTEE